eukprot:scaffold50669_cov26-Tisochrysis_lutea.AAC.7
MMRVLSYKSQVVLGQVFRAEEAGAELASPEQLLTVATLLPVVQGQGQGPREEESCMLLRVRCGPSKVPGAPPEYRICSQKTTEPEVLPAHPRVHGLSRCGALDDRAIHGICGVRREFHQYFTLRRARRAAAAAGGREGARAP